MAEDISNKTLATLLAVAIVISLGGTLVVLKGGTTITGADTSVGGTSQVGIEGTAAIVFEENASSIDFGTGAVSTGANYSVLDSGVNDHGSVTDGTWAPLNDTEQDPQAAERQSEFIINNSGSVDVNVSLQAGKNATDLFGGTLNPSLYQYWANDSDTSGGCYNLTGGKLNTTGNEADDGTGEWLDLDKSDQLVCSNLTTGAGSNRVEVDLKLQIPVDVLPGTKTDTLTFTATAI